MVKTNNIIKTKIKKNTTDFCKDKFNKTSYSIYLVFRKKSK